MITVYFTIQKKKEYFASDQKLNNCSIVSSDIYALKFASNYLFLFVFGNVNNNHHFILYHATITDCCIYRESVIVCVTL